MTGHIRRRGKQSWELKLDIGNDPATGKRRIRYHSFKGTKREASIELARLVSANAKGEYVDPSKLTVSEFVQRWLRDWAEANTSNKTITRYEQLLRKHVCSALGNLPIQKLRASHLQERYAALARGGLADRTRLHVHRVIHRMLRHATQWGVVHQNVATLVDAPTVAAKEVNALSAADVRAVLERLRGRSLFPIASLALATGMRRGELLGLRWQDVDLDGAKVRVERSLEQTTRGGLVFKAPKTRHGRRAITLPPSSVAELRAHWRAQQEQRLALGLGKAPDDAPVFATWDGSVRSPNGFTKEWSLAMSKAGLAITFHSLRHTHASTLIAAGLDVLTISRRLGHGSPTITLAVYGHLFRPDDRAAQVMEAALAGSE
jgi:integrase